MGNTFQNIPDLKKVNHFPHTYFNGSDKVLSLLIFSGKYFRNEI